MNSLSTILAEIEVSAEKISVLETDLATEREHGKTLVEQYRSQSGDALKMLGIAASSERKPRTNEAVLMSAANRKSRQMAKGGEKNAKTLLAAAIDAAEQVAKTKLGLSELPAAIKLRIEEKLKTPRAK